ncbi:hypothetical protein LTR70_010774 [Exophiala xenobiotica]|uniref:Heterokaryon incompatibility domain-containing protein n=1 Tax=Lithohypha guttulata TaxID=1690604 RepID=A0ABR0JSU4_9EURO|nr:hypothetical protein LTR24_010755 [Lithohypha guttulata]KAK5308849.1 hypothetical protein LTR70_010774 [Exophiala xenobiotica]
MQIIIWQIRALVPLKSQPEYFALSYTWGRPGPQFPSEWDDPTATRGITVNGKSFQVRLNLHEALHMLRRRWSEDFTWWIDAICINQDDIPERNSQVSRMGEIYKKCTGTVVWLGPADSTTETAIPKIIELAESWEQHPDSLTTVGVADENIEGYRVRAKSSFRSGSAPFLGSLAAAVPEILVDKSLDRPRNMPSTHSYVPMWSLRNKLIQVSSIAEQMNNRSLGNANDFEQRSLSLAMMRSLHGSMTAATELLLLIADHKKSTNAGMETELTALLEQYRSTLATDLRDKVYAALGISRNEEKIEPDYSLPVEDVYVHAAKRSIETTQSFRILTHCRFPPRLGGLPSWVPDWTDWEASTRTGLPQRDYKGRGIRNEDKMYAATGDLQADFRFEEHDRELIVKGTIFDELVFVSTRCSYGTVRNPSRSFGNNSQSLEDDVASREADAAKVLHRQWLREWAAFQSSTKHEFAWIDHGDWTYQPEGGNDQFDKLTYVPTGEALNVAYLRTLAADVCLNLANGRELRISDKNCEGVQDLSWCLEEACMRRCFGRAFAVSELGLLMLVPAEAQIGDGIAFVQGSEVPFILRPSRADVLFIGECYIHGLMDGEVWREIEKHGILTELRLI